MTTKRLLCISSINWNFIWQRHQTFMRGFAEEGWEVDYIENSYFRNPAWHDYYRGLQSIRNKFSKSRDATLNELPSGIKLIKPNVLPPNGNLFRFLNRKILVPRLVKRLRKDYDMVFLYMPSYTTDLLLNSMPRTFVVFDYVANFEGHPQKPSDYSEIEKRLLEKADLVTTDSNYLYKFLIHKHSNVFQIHHGVQTRFFYKDSVKVSQVYKKICFFGGIDDRIDWSSIQALQDSGYEVTLIGPSKVKIPPGVRAKPAMNLKELSKEIINYDAFIIPYLLSSYSDGIIPAKIFECFATGKPVLTSPLVSLASISDLLYICNGPSDYLECMQKLPITENEDKIRQRQELSLAQSSDTNFKNYLHVVEHERGLYEKKHLARN